MSLFDHGQDTASLLERISELERRHKKDKAIIANQKQTIRDLELTIERLRQTGRKMELTGSVKFSTSDLCEFYNDIFVTDLTR
jgi:hypothetical protein